MFMDVLVDDCGQANDHKGMETGGGGGTGDDNAIAIAGRTRQ
jgi:hypothetical protein